MATIPDKVAQFVADVDIAHQIIHGPATGSQSQVETDGGLVKTLARAMSEGVTGPENTLTIGTVTTLEAGATATATITGTAPNQVLHLGIPRGSVGQAGQAAPKHVQAACSDLTTPLTAGEGKAIFRMPYSMTLASVRASLAVASSSGPVEIDVKASGATVFSTKLTIDENERTSITATVAAVLNPGTILADDSEVVVIVNSAGNGARGLIVTLLGS